MDSTKNAKKEQNAMNGHSFELYVKLTPGRNESIFSGIRFVDFIKCTPLTISNILLPKPVYLGEKYCHNFELFEGADEIAFLASQNIYNYGDFCFVDYANADSVRSLSKEQVAELLYLMHIKEPLQFPFFDVLQNNYAYLSHDDGWYCKLYCKDWQAPISIFLNKLLKSVQELFDDSISSLPDSLAEKIVELSTLGLFVKLEISRQKNKVTHKGKTATIKLYEVGEHDDIDNLFNNIKSIISKVSFELQL